jgi:prepilin signal peptidase PulO-like enzyme (type II secretory pathway)
MLVALLVYDFRWMLLPDTLVFPLIALGLVDAGIRLSLQPDFSVLTYLQHVILGAGALGGFYWLLHVISKGKWVGFGDVKLGLFMGIVLGWQQALLALFLANVIGFFVVAPGLASGKLTPKSRVPFGPFLVVAFLAAGLFGHSIITWYLSLILPR